MGINRRVLVKYTTVIGVLLLFLSSCVKEHDLGIDLLPSEDIIGIHSVVIKDDISSYIVTEKPMALNQSSTNLLGTFNDPKFGKTSVDFASHYRPTVYNDFGTNPVVDSVRLQLVYQTYYGDTLTEQKLKVYEIINQIEADSVYKANIDLSQYASSEVIGEGSFIPQFNIDSVDNKPTIRYQIISIPVEKELGERLIGLDSTIMTNIDEFLKVFKGLLIASDENIDGTGALVSLENSSTRLIVYYNNDENKAKDIEEQKQLSYGYYVTKFSARVNSYAHDYNSTEFFSKIDDETVKSEQIFIQPTFGLQSKITIDGLESWKDSSNITINKAELIFTVDTLSTDYKVYLPPYQLYFTVVDEDGNEALPKDFYLNSDLYGGKYNSTLSNYSFNITQHIQDIIENDEVNNNGFYLSTAYKTGIANRVILKGSESDEGIKLIITYSKFAQ